jgi:hypothetical protein
MLKQMGSSFAFLSQEDLRRSYVKSIINVLLITNLILITLYFTHMIRFLL